MELLASTEIATAKTRVFQLKFPTPNVWTKSLCLSINIKSGESFIYERFDDIKAVATKAVATREVLMNRLRR